MIYIRYLLFFIVIFLVPSTVSAETIHGTVYEWSTFEPLDNALIEVNSTPVQFRVATSGVYSFNLPRGDYLLKTSYYQNDTLVYYSEDNITVTDPLGDYVLDILLFPLDEEDDDLSDVDIGNVTFDMGDKPFFNWINISLAVILLIIAAAAYYRYRKSEVTEIEPAPEIYREEPQESRPDTSAPLPDDLKEIITILEGTGGRITQKDLRNKLNCSEAKVSLMVTDLETRGLLQKIKKGRGNIILLNRGIDK